MKSSKIVAVSLLALVGAAGLAHAKSVQLRVTVQNLAPANSVAFAPLRLGIGNGTFDAFNENQTAFLLGQPTVATAPIVTVAEGGSGSTWLPAFAAAEPNATIGSIMAPGGPLLPGATASNIFIVDPQVNRFFTFAAMVVPSNDHFIGNDDPTEYMLFDAAGNLNLTSISQLGSEVWDAGSEVTDPANAAFLMGGVNANRVDENGVVRFDFMGLNAYNGLTTAAGYTFNRQFGANDEIYRISFEVIPAPGAAALLGLGGLVGLRRRR
jgi:hypothetical protein